ncbi:TrkH family potassium uptake protein [Nocardioides limicola]|uniref:TrkH family potassium uptake protein n=1 Tax=Nocardioides limicola TaxID=2803368 RepID=UPI00193B3438|nr:potassium transporter TrkG [Nocardioides sp. DJM-14]
MRRQTVAPRRFFRHPSQVVVTAFAVVIAVGTALLMLPWARTGPEAASFVEALFTSTSAVCVTGLIIVDTPTYWSPFGQVVILALIQVGGFGIMTMASLLGLIVARRLGLRSRLTAAAETKAMGIGDIRSVLVGVAKITIVFEAATALFLWVRLMVGYDEGVGRAAYLAVFHSISAFNNAGFALYEDSLERFVTDAWICLPIAVAVICGGLGFPVIMELSRRVAPRHWSIHTKLTLSMTVVLLVGGTVFMAASEWRNQATLGGLDTPYKLMASFFHSVMPRTAGFNSLDVGAMNEGTWLGTIVLMFIGGGSAGTAGGIKVTTFVILLFVIIAEVRGQQQVNAFDRRIGERVQRQALTVALLSVAAVVAASLALLEMTDHTFGRVLFEATSAFATVGLSTGITDDLPAAGHLLLVGLMFLGRLGPITLVSALALRERQIRHTLPEERPIIG